MESSTGSDSAVMASHIFSLVTDARGGRGRLDHFLSAEAYLTEDFKKKKTPSVILPLKCDLLFAHSILQ